MIQIIGKRNRPVPILLTSEMLAAMEVLNATRETCNVTSESFFAVPGTGQKLHFFPVLQRVARLAKMSRPELLTTTRMRKHHATMAQV